MPFLPGHLQLATPVPTVTESPPRATILFTHSERGEGTWPATQAYALTGNATGSPLVRRPALNPLSHTNQGEALDFKLGS